MLEFRPLHSTTSRECSYHVIARECVIACSPPPFAWALFPSVDWKGDLKSDQSQIHTLGFPSGQQTLILVFCNPKFSERDTVHPIGCTGLWRPCARPQDLWTVRVVSDQNPFSWILPRPADPDVGVSLPTIQSQIRSQG